MHGFRYDRRSDSSTEVTSGPRVYSVSFPNTTLTLESVLHIRNASDADSGVYECKAVSTDDSDITDSATQVELCFAIMALLLFL